MDADAVDRRLEGQAECSVRTTQAKGIDVILLVRARYIDVHLRHPFSRGIADGSGDLCGGLARQAPTDRRPNSKPMNKLLIITGIV